VFTLFLARPGRRRRRRRQGNLWAGQGACTSAGSRGGTWALNPLRRKRGPVGLRLFTTEGVALRPMSAILVVVKRSRAASP